MDLVHIGFKVDAKGLKEANNEVDSLLGKVDQVGTKGKKSASEFENSQKKIKKATEQSTKAAETNTKAVDRTTVALERQRIIGEYLGKGLDKSTASSLANFRQLKASAIDTNSMFTLLGDNAALNKTNKQAKAITESLDKMKLDLDLVGKGFSASEQAQIRQLKLNGANNAEIEKAIELIKKRKQAEVLADYQNQKASLSREWMAAYDKEIEARVAKEKEAVAKIQQVRDTVSNYDATSKRSFGGGILDQVEAENKGILELRKQYLDETRAIADKERASIKQANDEREKALRIEQTRAKYISQGFGKTDAGKLASLEVSGASTADLEKRAEAIRNNSKALSELHPKTVVATESNNKLLASIKGIAAYALLSTAIYGVITATSSLVVATVQIADEYTSIQNRMKLYIDDAGELAKVNANLAQYSMENNVGLRETATLFARLQPAMQKIGANTAATASIVDAFGKSMRIGGATAMEAASATIQFSQAMASGKLAGDEFRSISEASPRFLKAIADGSGIAANRLKEMSAAGLLTTEVISKALLKEYPKLIEENKRLGATLEQGANAITTAFTVMVGEFNEGAGITKTVGAAMLDLGQSMFKAAQSAKETGAAVSKWFGDNATIIGNVIDAVQLLAITWASRYVASIGLALAATLRQNAALVTSNGLMQTLGVTALRTGMAMQTAFTFFGGWAGILTTIATVAATYLLLRDNTAQATGKIVEQSKYVDMSTESFKKLNAEQQKNVQASLGEDIAKANEQLDKQANTVNRVLLSYAQFAQMQGKALNSDVTDVINQTVKGLMDYDTAYRKLLELGVPKNVLEDFKKQKDVYDETASSSLKLEAAAKAAGMGIKLGGNEAQNAQPSVRGLASAVDDLGDASVRAANAFKDLVAAYSSEVVSLQKQTALMASSGLDAQLSGRVIKESNNLAERNEKIADGTKAIENYRTAVSKLGAEEQKQHQATIKVLEERLKKSQENLAAFYAKGLTPSAQALQAAQDDQAKLVEARNKADRDTNKKGEVNNYPEQIRELERVASLLEKGAGLEVAKIASQKEYVKWYGSNLDVARQIVAIDERRLALEKSIADAKKRDETSKTLKEQISSYAEIAKFVNDGFTVTVAQQAINDGFVYSAEGVAHANNLVLKSLNDQIGASLDELRLQQDIRDFVKGGLSVEQATANAIIYRNKHLNKTLVSKTAELALTKEQVVVEQSRVAYEQEINSLKNQANDLALTQDNALAEITLKYKGIGIEEAKSLKTKQDIVSKLTEYNELLGKQRTLAYDIENVNFDVFGDFGNPFQSASEGLNSLLFGMDDLKNKYANMYSDLDARIAKEQEGTVAQEALLTQKANLEMMYIEDSKKARDQAITSGLSLTKSLFKEDSKGYKIVSGMEKAYQASKIAFALWEKKDVIAFNALKLQAYVTDTLGFTTGAYAKIVAQEALNIAQAQGAVASAAQAPPPVGFASAAAMIALMAGIGIAISGGGGSGSFAATNEGKGTVFGDSEAQSASIKNSIDLLSKNSDLMLPLTSAMLKSLRNIESSIGGVTNLILRQATSGSGFSISEGFSQNSIGKAFTSFSDFMNKITFGLSDFFTGGIIGKVLGGLFGSKTTIKGQGLFGSAQKLGDILTKGFDLVEYIDVQVKKKTLGITTSTKNSTKFAAADEALTKQFTLIFTGFYDSILSATDILGADTNSVKTKLENAIVNIGKIDLKGLNGEQIQERLEAVFGAAADKLAQQGFAGLDEFQKVGEGYYETLIRVAGAVEQAKYFTDRLNVTAIEYTDILNKQGDVAAEIVRQSVLLNETTKDIKGGFYDLVNSFDGTAEELTDFVMTLRDLQDQLFMTGKNADYLTSAMILGAGGIDKLSSGLDAYFEMLSPAEQAAELTRRLTNEFAIFGKELPSDVKAFRALVSSIDISTEAGQKLYGQILALAPEFNDLQDALEAANSDINELVNSLRDLAEQARAARGETEVVRNLDYLRNEFNKASELAMQGDVDAANRLLELGSSLMNASKLYSLSSSEYARDLALIQRAATVAADVQEAGLGYATSLSLTPSASTTSTPTVNTDTSTTDARLDALSEKLEAGLFAIAKYTQDSANRLERWDYGDRMVVRIEQDSDADTIPTKVIA